MPVNRRDCHFPPKRLLNYLADRMGILQFPIQFQVHIPNVVDALNLTMEHKLIGWINIKNQFTLKWVTEAKKRDTYIYNVILGTMRIRSTYIKPISIFHRLYHTYVIAAFKTLHSVINIIIGYKKKIMLIRIVIFHSICSHFDLANANWR